MPRTLTNYQKYSMARGRAAKARAEWIAFAEGSRAKGDNSIEQDVEWCRLLRRYESMKASADTLRQAWFNEIKSRYASWDVNANQA
jgi:hypothetical protein